MNNQPSRVVLLGHPVSHSRSPYFQNAAIRFAGLQATYEALDVAPADLGSVIEELRLAGTGGNVTVPHKRVVAAMCDVLSPTARRTGAVNTFRMVDGAMHGDNTDVEGFSRAVQSLGGRQPSHEKVALIGAGGAAAAVLAAVEEWPSSTAVVFNRTRGRCTELVANFSGIATEGDALSATLRGATLVVNATPVGLTGDESPFDAALLPDGCKVLDLVYRPGETRLVREARARGYTAADGREMLLEQGALAFVQWFGCEPNKMVMRTALEGAMLLG